MTDPIERAAQRTEEEIRRRRRRRYARLNRKGFRIHATVFVAVQTLLVAVWALQWQLGGTGYPWFLYALAGWGIGLAIHYAVIRDSFGTAAASIGLP
jgi:2TM domain-containing protein